MATDYNECQENTIKRSNTTELIHYIKSVGKKLSWLTHNGFSILREQKVRYTNARKGVTVKWKIIMKTIIGTQPYMTPYSHFFTLWTTISGAVLTNKTQWAWQCRTMMINKLYVCPWGTSHGLREHFNSHSSLSIINRNKKNCNITF